LHPTTGPGRIISKITNEIKHFTEPLTRHRDFGRCRPGTPANAGQRKINAFRQLGEDMVALKIEMNLKEISEKPENSGKAPKAKLTVFGEEIIEKEVKPGGNAGRVYLPLDWVGKCVKIIRID
jgi:putative transposon-encoded protein